MRYACFVELTFQDFPCIILSFLMSEAPMYEPSTPVPGAADCAMARAGALTRYASFVERTFQDFPCFNLSFLMSEVPLYQPVVSYERRAPVST